MHPMRFIYQDTIIYIQFKLIYLALGIKLFSEQKWHIRFLESGSFYLKWNQYLHVVCKITTNKYHSFIKMIKITM